MILEQSKEARPRLACRERPVRRVGFLTPEADQILELEFEQVGDRVRFRIPDFLVYGVVQVELSKPE